MRLNAELIADLNNDTKRLAKLRERHYQEWLGKVISHQRRRPIGIHLLFDKVAKQIIDLRADHNGEAPITEETATSILEQHLYSTNAKIGEERATLELRLHNLYSIYSDETEGATD